MEYIYAALLLHKAGHKVSEDSMKKVLEAAGAKSDHAQIKALVSALDGVNIDDALKQAAAAPVATAAAPAAGEAKAEEKSEADKAKEEESAGAGLAALFG